MERFEKTTLGVTFILFVGILMGHFGFTGNLQIINFVQDFGLILFVFCIGLQVGPSFFSSFRKGGVSMNLMAAGAILLNIAVMVVLWLCLFEKEDLPMMVGVLCGAVTNTPGLGAASEALGQVGYSGPQIANGYACAYPLGVVGIIAATILLKYLCKINLGGEKEQRSRGSVRWRTVTSSVQGYFTTAQKAFLTGTQCCIRETIF